MSQAVQVEDYSCRTDVPLKKSLTIKCLIQTLIVSFLLIFYIKPKYFLIIWPLKIVLQVVLQYELTSMITLTKHSNVIIISLIIYHKTLTTNSVDG